MTARVPRPPLDAFVEVIWLMPAGGHGRAPVLALPTGTVELVVELGPGGGHAELCGVHTRPFRIEGGAAGRTLGVHFRPGGAAALLPIPPQETLEQRCALSEVLAGESRRLEDLLAGAPDDDPTLLRHVEAFLTARLREARSPLVLWALDALDRPDRPDVSALVDRSGYSHRRFNELFRREVGMTPKRYSRIARLQQTVGRLDPERATDWADVAVACGFHDQAHLIHEFRRHFTLTPEAYLARRVGHPNHPLAD